jgi:hypothetical protein
MLICPGMMHGCAAVERSYMAAVVHRRTTELLLLWHDCSLLWNEWMTEWLCAQKALPFIRYNCLTGRTVMGWAYHVTAGASDYQSTNGCLAAQWCKKGHFWIVVWFWLRELVWHAALESGLVKEPFLTTVGSSHSSHKIHNLLWPQWSCECVWSLIWEVIYVLWLSAAVDYIRQLDVTLLFFLIGDFWMSCMLLPVTWSSDVWNKMGSTARQHS